MTARRIAVAVLVTVEHEAGPDTADVLVLDEVGRQVHGLGPLVVDTRVGAVSVWHVVDAEADEVEGE